MTAGNNLLLRRPSTKRLLAAAETGRVACHGAQAETRTVLGDVGRFNSRDTDTEDRVTTEESPSSPTGARKHLASGK